MQEHGQRRTSGNRENAIPTQQQTPQTASFDASLTNGHPHGQFAPQFGQDIFTLGRHVLEADFVRNVLVSRWNQGKNGLSSGGCLSEPVSLFPAIAALEIPDHLRNTKICSTDFNICHCAACGNPQRMAVTVSNQAPMRPPSSSINRKFIFPPAASTLRNIVAKISIN